MRVRFFAEQHWWYLSFSGDEGWCGFALVQGDDVLDAAREAHALGINPGGEVFGVSLPPERKPPLEWRHRLFTQKQDVKDFDSAMGGRGRMVSEKGEPRE